MNNILIRLQGIKDPITKTAVTLVKTLPFDHNDPDVDYLANLSVGDEIILNTHGSRGIFKVFSSVHGTVSSIQKWTRLNPRRTDLQGLCVKVTSFHVSTHKPGIILNAEHGSEEILKNGWEIE